MFLAKVLCVHSYKAWLDPKGSFDLALADPIVYCHGNYTTPGKKIGHFGWSVKKCKKKG